MLEDTRMKYIYITMDFIFPNRGAKLYCFVFQHGTCRTPIRFQRDMKFIPLDPMLLSPSPCQLLAPISFPWSQRFSFTTKREERERSDERKPLVAHDAKLTITHRCQLYNTKSINKQPIALHTCQVTTANQSML